MITIGIHESIQPVQISRESVLAYGICCRRRCSELERAASQARSNHLEDRLRDLILTTQNESVAAAKRAEEAAVGAFRSSLCGLELQAASADLAAAATTRSYLALLERDGLTAAVSDGGPGAQDP